MMRSVQEFRGGRCPPYACGGRCPPCAFAFNFVLRAAVCVFLSVICGCASTPAAHDQSAGGDYTETIRGTTIEFDMVWVPAEGDVGGFWIGRTEVTWDEYLAFCGFSLEEPLPPGADAVSRPSRPLETFPYDRNWGKGQRPAIGMSWNAAKHYCQWLSGNTGNTYRLPTEDEWRLACGDGPFEPLTDFAWFAANSNERTHPVASRQPNSRGIHDMLGNVWEYCDNPFDSERRTLAALRGGSWASEAAEVSPDSRIQFQRLWVLADPNVPPGVWWVPDGEMLGFRILRPGPAVSP